MCRETHEPTLAVQECPHIGSRHVTDLREDVLCGKLRPSSRPVDGVADMIKSSSRLSCRHLLRSSCLPGRRLVGALLRVFTHCQNNNSLVCYHYMTIALLVASCEERQMFPQAGDVHEDSFPTHLVSHCCTR